MKKSSLIAAILFAACFASAQFLPVSYPILVRKADSLYNSKEYAKSALAYTEAFKANSWKGTSSDRYNAAFAWALAGKSDSAFFQLNRIATLMNYTNFGHITTDKDLVSLHADSRWEPLLESIKQNKVKAEANFNRQLITELDSIYQDDQSCRKQISAIEKEFGNESKEMDALWRTILEKDSINVIKVTSIHDKYGWLGADVVGPQGNMTLFLVIQHSDQSTQEKYLPMMRDAVKNGKAQAGSLTLLEDRVALAQGKRQVYGSQIGTNTKTQKHYVLPLEDPDNVDKRRASVGLQPLGEYVIRWDIKWDPEQYKKDLPLIESKQNLK